MHIGVHGKRSFYTSEFNQNVNILKNSSQKFPGIKFHEKVSSCSRVVVCVRTAEQKGRAIVTDRGQLRIINITSKHLYVRTFVIANINRLFHQNCFSQFYTPLPQVIKNSKYFF